MRKTALPVFIAAFVPQAAAAKGGVKVLIPSPKLTEGPGRPARKPARTAARRPSSCRQRHTQVPGEVRRCLGERNSEPERPYLAKPWAGPQGRSWADTGFTAIAACRATIAQYRQRGRTWYAGAAQGLEGRIGRFSSPVSSLFHFSDGPCSPESHQCEGYMTRKGRSLSRRAALSSRRLAILRGVRRVGAGGRSAYGTLRIKWRNGLFSVQASFFR